MKNSEWGAVAFLTHSKYGRKGQEVTINSNSSYYTGGGTGEAYKTTNTNQSSTGNITGIYDLNGGAIEYVAAFNGNYSGEYYTGSSYVDAEGNNFANTGGKSTKYATAYSGTLISSAYKRGDATYETTGWNGDNEFFITSDRTFFIRSGSYLAGSSAGIFYYNSVNGGYNNEDIYRYSFRICLA